LFIACLPAKGVETILLGIIQQFSHDDDVINAGFQLFDNLKSGLSKIQYESRVNGNV